MCVLEKPNENLAEISVSNYLTGSPPVFERDNNHQEANKTAPRQNQTSGVTGEYKVSVKSLRDLCQLKGAEVTRGLNEQYGGLESLARDLNTDLQNGLDDRDEHNLEIRLKNFGKNEISARPPKSFMALALHALHDPTLVMLTICSIISIALSFYHPGDEKLQNETIQDLAEGGHKPPRPHHSETSLEWIEGVSILVAVFVVVMVSAFNDWRKEKQFRSLKDRIEQENLTSVVRNGEIKQINIKNLLVGDVCCIKYGDLIPADGVLVMSSDLKIDESSLTGESDLIRKDANGDILILSGTHVMEGSGQFLVLAVGINSQTGIIMSLLNDTDEKPSIKKRIIMKLTKKKNAKELKEDEDEDSTTNDDKDKKDKKKKKKKSNKSVLQKKLGKLALNIGYIGITLAALTFIILVIRLCVHEFVIKKQKWSNVYVKHILSFLIQAITVIVVSVPEGLPLAVTIALAYAIRQMTKENNLVRHLDACETMGNATTICSDKTGTLTTNRMTVVQCWIAGTLHKSIPKDVPKHLTSLIAESISVNTNYTSMIEVPKSVGEFAKQIGNKTECALLGYVNELGENYARVRENFPSEQFTKVYTFNSARKMMSTIVEMKAKPGYRLYTKGASEIVLGKCTHYMNTDGEVVRLTADGIENIITSVVEPMACDGLRTICIAYREFRRTDIAQEDSDIHYYQQEAPNWDDEASIIQNLTCLCLVGIEDPVRPEVPDAIRKCQEAGIVVRMVTGDNVNTARSIALKCGIIHPDEPFLVLESKDFNQQIRDDKGEVDQKLLDKVWPNLRVLARSTPQDKYVLVNGIVESKQSKNRDVVAVTGDGTNDGPALKIADVGFAMGIQGTDVAKEASDIILTDDNFSSIVRAVVWGRNVYDAIAKFLQFQLTANFSAAIFSIVCAATIEAVPVKAVQMIWVNMVMDTLASLALSTEPPNDAKLLKRKPYGRNKSVISTTITKAIIGHNIYQLTILFLLVWKIESWMGVENVTKYDDILILKEPSLHFTIIFNGFVQMTMFNEINARKIHNERNVFDGLIKNKYFLIIWIFCFCIQIIIVQFGGLVFAVVRLGWREWLWCIAFGIGSLIWHQVVLFFPDSWMKKIVRTFKCCSKKSRSGSNDDDDDEEDDEETKARKEKIDKLKKITKLVLTTGKR